MAVPGRNVTGTAPRALAETELYTVDAYLSRFDAAVAEVDRDGRRLALRRTAFFPGGGGQPADLGRLRWDGGSAAVVRVSRDRSSGTIWHEIDTEDLPAPGAEVEGVLDWERRHLTMRTHSALHILCGVIWSEFGLAVTGGNMEPGRGRLDFPFEAMSTELGSHVERRINDEIDAARAILVDFVGRDVADGDPVLVRTAAHLIPREIDPLRVIDIVGLDKQADGGTHVLSTAEVGRVAVTGTESKGKGNKRIRLEVRDRAEAGPSD